MDISINHDLIKNVSEKFNSQPQNVLIGNAIIKGGLNSAAFNNDSIIDMQYTFSNDLKTGEITNQKQSGRCWLFAGLNVMRYRVMHKLNLETFELSQNYMMFWDKFEKANYFLESIIDTVQEDVDSRIVSWLLSDPIGDGGQWDMFMNLVQKYGMVPKNVMPETFHSSQTGAMNRLLIIRLRKGAAELRDLFADKKSFEELRSQKEKILQDVYSILCLCLGQPRSVFDFEYRDKEDNFYRDTGLTALEFYKKYVDFDRDQYISIINAPTDDKPFNNTYTVKYLGNVKEGKKILYLNVDIDTLKKLAVAQLEDGEPIWFGCDVGKMMDRDSGIMDTNLYKYDSLLNVSFHMTKAQRLDYRESCLTHAMVFTGVNITDGKPNRWKVENSWGDANGNKGFYIMSDDWFDEYLYQVVIDKKYLTKELLEVLEKKPIELQPWDPMGSLALTR